MAAPNTLPLVKVTALFSPLDGAPALLPLAHCGVSAGFPSPALDHAEEPLDIGAYLIRHPASTFLIKASGDSMNGKGILDGALLVVDRSEQARDGDIVIAVLDGELLVKQLRLVKGQAFLESGNDRFPSVKVSGENSVWGVVVHAINSFRRPHVRSV